MPDASGSDPGRRATPRPGPRNVLGEPLAECCTSPLTGFYRTGSCETGPEDFGVHTVCARVDAEFLAFSRAAGNDLSSAVPEAGYCEFNFAPSTQWAAYVFDGYRSFMRDADGIDTPRIDIRSDSARLELEVSLDLDSLLPRDAVWQLGLAAVIEETNGRKSYWALAHPPGKPDFHHSDCFALELPAPLQP